VTRGTGWFDISSVLHLDEDYELIAGVTSQPIERLTLG
jgi:hypothetical protein